jgi:hypothetical protein
MSPVGELVRHRSTDKDTEPKNLFRFMGAANG